jgi:hypothetical protein
MADGGWGFLLVAGCKHLPKANGDPHKLTGLEVDRLHNSKALVLREALESILQEACCNEQEYVVACT